MREPARIVGIFWDPKPVFEDLAAQPRWWTPLILATAVSLVFTAAFSRRIGWDRFLEQEMRTNPRLEQLTAEQRQAILAQQARFVGSFSYAAAAAGAAASYLAAAAVLLGGFRIFGTGEIRFRQAFSITAYSYLPMVLASALAIVAMHLADPESFDVRNPLMLNAGWLGQGAASPAWLRALAGSIDLFSIWVILLLALGFSVASRGLAYARSLGLVAAVWLVYVALKTGWAALVG